MNGFLLVTFLLLISFKPNLMSLQGIEQRIKFYTSVRSILIPLEGCALPCALGIQPGATSKAEAEMQLTSDLWSRGTDFYDSKGQDRFSLVEETQVSWEWNGTQPSWLHSGLMGFSWLQDGTPIVEYLRFGTKLTILDSLIALGKPQGGHYIPRYTGVDHAPWCSLSLYEADYADDLHVFAWIKQPVNPITFWLAPAWIQYGAGNLYPADTPYVSDDYCWAITAP